MPSTTIRLDSKSLSGLLGDAYDAGLNPSAWRHFAEEAAHACDAQLAMVEYQDEHDARRSFLATGGLNGFEEIFAAHRSSSSDDNYLLAIRGQPAGTVRLGSEVVPPEAMRKSRAYTQLARPWDLEHFLFGAIESAPGVNAFFSLCRTAQEDPFLPGDKALISHLLLRHLQRSVALHRSLDAARGGNALLSGVLDLARYGIVLFDQRGRPILRNRAANALLDTGDGLALRNGNLQTTDGATQTRLDSGLEAAQQSALGWSVAPPRTGAGRAARESQSLPGDVLPAPPAGRPVRPALRVGGAGRHSRRAPRQCTGTTARTQGHLRAFPGGGHPLWGPAGGQVPAGSRDRAGHQPQHGQDAPDPDLRQDGGTLPGGAAPAAGLWRPEPG